MIFFEGIQLWALLDPIWFEIHEELLTTVSLSSIRIPANIKWRKKHHLWISTSIMDLFPYVFHKRKIDVNFEKFHILQEQTLGDVFLVILYSWLVILLSGFIRRQMYNANMRDKKVISPFSQFQHYINAPHSQELILYKRRGRLWTTSL